MKVGVYGSIKKYEYSPGLVREICARLFEHFGVSDDYELAVHFRSAAGMRALNREYRGKNSTTDVLSFAVNEGEPVERRGRENGVPKLLGDIVLCPDHIFRRNVIEGGASLAEETAYLLVHGFMHLIGYDHGEDAFEDSKMRRDADRFYAAEIAVMNLGRLIKTSKG